MLESVVLHALVNNLFLYGCLFLDRSSVRWRLAESFWGGGSLFLISIQKTFHYTKLVLIQSLHYIYICIFRLMLRFLQKKTAVSCFFRVCYISHYPTLADGPRIPHSSNSLTALRPSLKTPHRRAVSYLCFRIYFETKLVFFIKLKILFKTNWRNKFKYQWCVCRCSPTTLKENSISVGTVTYCILQIFELMFEVFLSFGFGFMTLFFIFLSSHAVKSDTMSENPPTKPTLQYAGLFLFLKTFRFAGFIKVQVLHFTIQKFQ